MAQRYTRKHTEECAEFLAKTLGKEFGKCWTKRKGKNVAKVGCWDIDCNPTYGGCVITEIVNVGGGITHPLGSTRKKPSAFCEATDFARYAVDIARKKK